MQALGGAWMEQDCDGSPCPAPLGKTVAANARYGRPGEGSLGKLLPPQTARVVKRRGKIIKLMPKHGRDGKQVRVDSMSSMEESVSMSTNKEGRRQGTLWPAWGSLRGNGPWVALCTAAAAAAAAWHWVGP